MKASRLVVAAAVAFSIAVLPAGGADSLTPASTTLTLVRGGSQTIEQVLHLDALPQKADVVIAVDTTGSMGGAIADAKADATAIVTGVKGLIPGARFAVVDFKDYPITPFGGFNDFPYLLRQPLTNDADLVQGAIDGMSASGGGDLPESHNRVFFETYSDDRLEYDAQATRILIVLTDAIPHDTQQGTSFLACPSTAVTDPGRDGAVNTADDLRTRIVLDGLVANNTTLSVITYPTFGSDPAAPACLNALAQATGGTQVAKGESASLLTLIQNLVTQQAQRIDEITFRVAKPAGWTVSLNPPPPYGPFTAPRDIPFTETITVPADAALGLHTITVTALVDGAERATHTVDVDVKLQAIGGLSVSVDRRSAQAGIASFPPSVVPAARIPFFGGASVASAPVGSIPVGSIPVGSIPVGSIPVGSIPVGSIPVGSIPVGSIPVGSIGLLSLPVGSIPVGSIPVGSIPVGSIGLDGILVSSLPLAPDSGTTWAAILAGTPLAGRPLQTLTLLDVARDATAGARFNALELKDVPFFSSLLRGVKLASALLGTARLSEIPAPGAAGSWTALLDASGGSSAGVDPDKNTVLGLDLAGRLGSTPVGSIPVGSIPVGSIPVGSIPVGSIVLERTRLAGVLVSVLGASQSVVNCDAAYCTATRTLGEAQRDGRILSSATIADLEPALDATGMTLGELIAALIGLENYPWHQVPLVGLQDVAGTGERPHYTVELDLACNLAPSLAGIKLALPPGFVPVSGSARWSFGAAGPVAGADAIQEGPAFKWSPPASVCGESTLTRHVKFEVDTFAGLDLGDFTASATATASSGASLSVSGQAPILVVQNHEANDLQASATTIEKHRVYAFHVASAGDKEVFSLPIPARNTRTKISLHVPPGADLDLVLGKPESAALNSAPVGSIPVGSIPVGSIALPDDGATANDTTRSPQPDTLQDIPVGSIPVGSISANRGSADEAVQVVSQGEGGRYTVVVSGYSGSHSPKPATLYVTETPPPPLPACAARSFPNSSSTVGTLPASLPAGTKTLFLVNRNQMARLHGDAAVQTLLDYIGDQASPGTLAGRPEVAGSVLQIDGAAAVRDAYAAWNAAPCSVEAANGAVRAANDVVGSFLAGLPNLKYVVLLGSDEAVPSGRVPDPVLISPELDNASDLAFTTAGLTNGNALYAAAATNHILSDAVYGAFTTIPWLGRQLNLPQVAVSRLLESPAEIGGQLAQYETANGLLTPTSAYVTGYGLLTDGAEAVRDGLTRPGLTTTLQTSPSWTKTTVADEFFAKTPVPDIGSINAHYNHYLAQPAAATSAADLFSTSIVPESLPLRVLFSMGCHGGLNVADSLLSGTLPPDALDWAQRYAQAKVAVYVANFTYGYADTEAMALSERLMALFAARAGVDDRTLAEQWVEALHTYFATVGTTYGVYDEKVMIGANLMGPPWYRVSGTPAAATPATTSTTTAGDGMVVSSLAMTPTSTQVGPGSGGGPTYWRGESVLATHYRPIQPVSSQRIDPPPGTPPARGVFITGLTTHDVPDVLPVLAQPTVDLDAHEPKVTFDETFFPAGYVLLSRTGAQTRAVVAGGQFRPTPGSTRGTQRLVDSISFDVAYDSDEATPPTISEVGAIATGPSSIRVFVRATDAAGIRRAGALVNSGAPTWQFVPLASQGGGLFTADVTGATTSAEIVAEVENVHGYTGFSTKKGENFSPIVDTAGPEVIVDSPRPDGVYVLNEAVTPRFACSDAGGVASCVGPPVDTTTVGPHRYTAVGTDLSGASTVHDVPYVVHFAFDGFKQPVNNDRLNVAKPGSTVPLKWQLRDVGGAYQRDLNFVTSISTRANKCPAVTTEPLPSDILEDVAALRYDTAAEQYIFNLKTQKSWAGTCRTAYVALADGTVHTAAFSFK